MNTVKYEEQFKHVFLMENFGVGILPSMVNGCDNEVVFMILCLDNNRNVWIPYAEFFTEMGRWNESVPCEIVSTVHFTELHHLLKKAEDWCHENCITYITSQGKTAYNFADLHKEQKNCIQPCEVA